MRALGFAVPGALGVQEAGNILVCGWVGIGPQVAIELSLLKRIREVALGIPGLLAWQFLSTVITEGCSTFTAAQDVIQQVPLPFSIQAYRTVYRNLIVLAHNAVIVPFGLLLFKVPVDWQQHLH